MNRTATNTSLKTIPESPVSTCSNISSRQLESHWILCVRKYNIYTCIYIYLFKEGMGVLGGLLPQRRKK